MPTSGMSSQRIRSTKADTHSVQIPEGMNPLLPSKILVSTGPAYRDLGCTEFRTVEVNMIPPGEYEVSTTYSTFTDHA
jgi:hypothetical protein